MKFLLSPFILASIVVLGGLGIIYLLFGLGPNDSENPPIQSHRSFEMEIVSNVVGIMPSKTTEIRYLIKDDQGNIIKDFEVAHEKIMHFIVVRKDLQYFQHVHPNFDSNSGEFKIPLVFSTDGPFRLFSDFTPTTSQIGADGERLPVTISQDVNVGSLANYKPLPLNNLGDFGIFDGYGVQMTADPEIIYAQSNQNISFEITEDNKTITDLEPYLGALGHTVVLREGDLQFIHAHPTQKLTDPQTGSVNFAISFPEAGNYKMFSQFQHKGKIITSSFVVKVLEGTENIPQSSVAPEHMNH